MRNFDRCRATGAPPDRVADFGLHASETFEALGTELPRTIEYWSYDRIEAAVQKFSRAAISYHEELKTIANDHFDTIHKRWARRSKKQRENLLSEVWPSLPDTPCGDLTLYREGVREGLTIEQRNVYLLPQINRAHLSQEAALLVWILARGRHPLHEFFRFDISCTKTAENEAKIMVFPSFNESLSGKTRLMHGDTKGRPDLYGKLIRYYNVNVFQEAIARDDMTVPGVGLLALEVQAKTNEILVKCCKLILHDSPTAQVQPSFPTQLWPQLTSGSSSIATTMARRVLDGPHVTDYDTMIMITSTRVEAMRDHLFRMREDPGYLEQAIVEIKEHILITFQDEASARRFMQQSQTQLGNIFPLLFAGHLSVLLFSQLRLWTALHHSLVELRDEARRLSTNRTKNGRAASRKFARARISTLSIVVPLLEVTTTSATLAFFASPQHRDKYAFGDPFNTEIIMHPDRTLSETGRKIEWVMNELHNNKAGYLGYENFVVEIGNYLDRKTGEEREVLSSYTTDQLANLAILFLCRTELDHSSHIMSRVFPDYSDLSALVDEVESEESVRWEILVPAQQTQNQTTVEQMRQAEARLDDGWARLLQHMDESNSSSFPFLNPTPQLRPAKETATKIPSLPKLKIKTRPPTSTNHISELESRPCTTALKPAPTDVVYEIDNRSLKVVRVLFFHAAPSSQPGEINWHDFLHAMARTTSRQTDIRNRKEIWLPSGSSLWLVREDV